MESALHTPPPTGKGVFWAMKEDWKSAVFFGLLFIAVTVIVLSPHLLKLSKNQERTFAAVTDHLRTFQLREPPEQRSATLSNSDGIFYWRGIIWLTEGQEYKPYVFAIKVDANDNYKVTSSDVFSYEPERAWKHGVSLDGN